jgi:hypothetical protein
MMNMINVNRVSCVCGGDHYSDLPYLHREDCPKYFVWYLETQLEIALAEKQVVKDELRAVKQNLDLESRAKQNLAKQLSVSKAQNEDARGVVLKLREQISPNQQTTIFSSVIN